MWKSLFGEKLTSKTGPVDTETELGGLDAVGIYFSAHWCPPCRGFTPTLATKFNELTEAGKKFKVVFASSDSDQAAFDSYYAEMPWLAMSYALRDEKEALATKYKCNGIPYLVILDGTTGEIITTNGRSGVSGANFIADFPWRPKVVPNIADDMEGIEDGKCLLVIQDCCSEDVQKANDAWLTPFGEANKTSKDFGRLFVLNGGARAGFFRSQLGFETVTPPHPHPLKQFTDFSEAYGHPSWGCDVCGKGPDTAEEQHHCKECQADYCKDCNAKSKLETPAHVKIPQMVVLNLTEKCYYYPLAGKTEATVENFKALVEDMKADKLTKTNLGEKPAA